MPGQHDKIIASVAKEILGPLGFRRKGRSRVWLQDRIWWLIVVEFQPSGWAKGSYLNVAAHWLWSEVDSLSFDFGGRLAAFEEYLSDEQFLPAARALAEMAKEEERRLAELFSSVGGAALVLGAQEAALNSHSWPNYHAGLASGLAGDPSTARALFNAVTHPPPKDSAAHMERLLANPLAFRGEVVFLIIKQRRALSLPYLEASLIESALLA